MHAVGRTRSNMRKIRKSQQHRIRENGSLFSFSVYGISVFLLSSIFCLTLISGSLSSLIENQAGSLAKYLDELLLSILLFYVFVVAFLTKKVYISKVVPWVIVFSIWTILSSLVNQVSAKIALLGFLLISKPLVIFLAHQLVLLNRRASLRMLKILAGIFCAVTIVAIGYMLVFEIVLESNPMHGTIPKDVRLGLKATRSFFIHPSAFSSIMTITAIYHFTHSLLMKSKFSFSLFLLSFIGVVLALRLKALLLLPICLLLVYYLVYVRQSKVKPTRFVIGISLSLIILIGLGVLVFLFQDILIDRLSEGVGTSSKAGRMLLLKTALLINKESLGLGSGLGTFGSAVSVSYHYSDIYYQYGIHNLRGGSPSNPAYITDQWWAWYLGEVGIIGTAIFGIALFVITDFLRRIAIYWQSRNAALSALAFASIGCLVYGILGGFAGAYLTAPPVGYCIMSLAGLSYALHRGMLRTKM